ncbi:hypothetical protein Ahy_B10g103802 [Arachis hypogaea]|uniref:SS18 N-terminal domain-containing protein n=1 Tax=Arachis hypogaea TaxID=3818 RepID=A0A444X459_ARAHY|nr:hypothetical protein Ahy_B10g103802 [Arachis hypogaea]
MFNGDPSPPLSTEMIQKYLEENKELIMATMDGQNQGKFAEASQLVALEQGQGQGMQHPHVATSQQQDLSTLNLRFDMNDNHLQQQQHHMAMSQQQQQNDLSTSKLAFQMSEQQQHKIPAFFQQQQQQQLMFGGSSNSGYYQAQTRLNNLSDMPETNHIASSDLSPVWSLAKSPSGNTRS